MAHQTLTRAAACLTPFHALAAATLRASLLAVGGSSVAAGARSPAASKLDLAVDAWMKHRTSESAHVLVRTAPGTRAAVLDRLRRSTGAAVTASSSPDLVVARLSQGGVRVALGDRDVTRISSDAPVQGLAVKATPAKPGSLTATATSSARVDLTWKDASSNETGFRIERCAGAGCQTFAEVATVGANLSSYGSAGLSANTTYAYRVRAYNASDNSAYSNTAEATTPAASATTSKTQSTVTTPSISSRICCRRRPPTASRSRQTPSKRCCSTRLFRWRTRTR